MSSFEYRRALPLVLDDVHRRTVAARLAELGFEVKTGEWGELEDLTNTYYDHGDVLRIVEYDGAHAFGPVLSHPHRLLESRDTDFASVLLMHTADLGGLALYREILIEDKVRPARSSYDRSRILLSPDLPPVAIHGDDVAYMTRGKPWPGSDVALVDAVRESFGQDAVEFIDEDVAASVIHALQQDTARIARVDR